MAAKGGDGLQAREELTERMCGKELGVYGQIFGTTGDTAALDRVERRFAWLRRRLRARDEVWGLFPESWRILQRLCLLFAQATRVQLAEILHNKVRLCPWCHVLMLKPLPLPAQHYFGRAMHPLAAQRVLF